MVPQKKKKTVDSITRRGILLGNTEHENWYSVGTCHLQSLGNGQGGSNDWWKETISQEEEM